MALPRAHPEPEAQREREEDVTTPEEWRQAARRAPSGSTRPIDVSYLGYDRCGLAVLLGAIEETASERLALPDRPDRWCVEAADRHRRAIAAVTAFAEP